MRLHHVENAQWQRCRLPSWVNRDENATLLRETDRRSEAADMEVRAAAIRTKHTEENP